MIYFDAAYIAKCYLNEPGADRVRQVAYGPEVVTAFRKRGDEVLGHGRTNSEHQNDFDEAGEAALIREVTEAITRFEGQPPRGWLSPGVNPSAVTPDLLQEAGYTYVLDWPMEDQPVWMNTRHGRILSIPYPHEVNDIPMIAIHHGTAPAFAEMIVENFDEMLDQSRSQPLVFGIALHAFFVGQPFRLRHLRTGLRARGAPPRGDLARNHQRDRAALRRARSHDTLIAGGRWTHGA